MQIWEKVCGLFYWWCHRADYLRPLSVDHPNALTLQIGRDARSRRLSYGKKTNSRRRSDAPTLDGQSSSPAPFVMRFRVGRNFRHPDSVGILGGSASGSSPCFPFLASSRGTAKTHLRFPTVTPPLSARCWTCIGMARSCSRAVGTSCGSRRLK